MTGYGVYIYEYVEVARTLVDVYARTFVLAPSMLLIVFFCLGISRSNIWLLENMHRGQIVLHNNQWRKREVLVKIHRERCAR